MERIYPICEISKHILNNLMPTKTLETVDDLINIKK
jgi:hypothetical protein